MKININNNMIICVLLYTKYMNFMYQRQIKNKWIVILKYDNSYGKKNNTIMPKIYLRIL